MPAASAAPGTSGDALLALLWLAALVPLLWAASRATGHLQLWWRRWSALLALAATGWIGVLVTLIFGQALAQGKGAQSGAWVALLIGLALLTPLGVMFARRRVVPRRSLDGEDDGPTQIVQRLRTARAQLTQGWRRSIDRARAHQQAAVAQRQAARDMKRAADKAGAAGGHRPVPARCDSAAAAPVAGDDDLESLVDDDDDDAATSAFSGVYRFEYMDAAGEIQEREAFITHVSESAGRLYFEGFRTDTHEDRSYRVDRVIGSLVEADTGELIEADELAGLLGDAVPRDTSAFTPAAGSAGRSDWRTGVCFAGFSPHERDELMELAEEADWMVFDSPHRAADYLVAGAKTPDETIDEANELGVTVISADTFRALV